jgi:hypothetical protein
MAGDAVWFGDHCQGRNPHSQLDFESIPMALGTGKKTGRGPSVDLVLFLNDLTDLEECL